MRIGVGVRVWGPVSVSGSIGGRRRLRRRGSGRGSTGCFPFFLAALVIGAFCAYPWLWFFAGAAVLVAISFYARKHMKDPPRQS
jgi:hypothetical protein